MKQNKNNDFRNWFLGTIAVGAIPLTIFAGFKAKTNKKLEQKITEPVKAVKNYIPEKQESNRQNFVKGFNNSPSSDYNKVSYQTNDFSKDSDKILLARMIYGEARNCSDEEKIAVAYTVINRANDSKKWNGENIKDCILKPWQYSCFNKNDVNRKKLKNPPKRVFEDYIKIAEDVLNGKYTELNKGQTHYFNPRVVRPKWADKLDRIGRIKNSKHEFYIEE